MKIELDIAKFKNIKYEQRTRCVICDTKMAAPVIRLPDFPMTEIYSSRPIAKKVGFLDQSFHFCANCGHGQLARVIDVELQYGQNFSYFFRTSESATARESGDFFLEFFKGAVGDRHFEHILELGCNDLYVLKTLQSQARQLTGVDPILKDKEVEFSKGKIKVIGDFFENIDLDMSKVDGIICKDTLEHVSDPKGFIKKLVAAVSDGTLFFFQFPCLETLLEGCRFDQIFHQHLNYFTLKSIFHMLKGLDCQLLDWQINQNHWGDILIAFQKGKSGKKVKTIFGDIKVDEILRRYEHFKHSMRLTSERLEDWKKENIYGYGAALMLPVLKYHLGGAFFYLQGVIDDDKRKEGLHYLNLPIRIMTWEHVEDVRNSIVMMTAIASINNIRNMLPKLFQLNPKHIILPLNMI